MKQMSLQVLYIDEFHFYLPEIGYLTPTPLECSSIRAYRIFRYFEISLGNTRSYKITGYI